ncbi:MAG: glycosyltransferase family 39 protein [Myxococcota bacterium]
MKRADAIAIAGVFCVALALRLVYLQQIESLPFFEFPLIDARSYDEWAQTIAAGDWLGGKIFYQAPAYPYFLGVIYSLFGHDPMVAHIVQMVMGAGSCVLLLLATRSLFGLRSAVAAGLLLAAYAPALFFDGIIQKTSLGLFLTSALIALVAQLAKRPGAGGAALAGAVAGLLALTRENALILALVISAWLLLRHRGAALRGRAVWAAAFVLGLAVVLLPVGARNLAVGDTFVITTSQLGPNFYIGNNPKATGLYAPLMPGRHTPDFEGRDATRAAEWETGRELLPGEVSSHWLGKSLEWIYEEPRAFLRLLFEKTLYTLNDYEIPDTEDIYVHAEFSWLLAGLHSVFRFGVLLPLALAGLVFAWREREPGGASELVATLAVVFTAAVAVFYVWARYRFPLVPMLVPFAGLAIVRSYETASRGAWRRLAAPTAALVVGAFVSNLTLFDREVLSQTAWVNLANIMLREQRLEEADAYLERATAIDHETADLHFHLASLRFRQDRPETEHHLRRMLSLDPTDFRGHLLLARVLKAEGRSAEANRHMREAIRLDPGRTRRGRPGAPIPVPERERNP